VICDGSGSHLRVAGKTLNSRSKLVQIAEDLKLPFSAIKDKLMHDYFNMIFREKKRIDWPTVVS
jgi:hypothetical protein